MMKVIAFNGSPRKEWNTAILLNKALEGAASQGAETKLVHLYDFQFSGCISCFACKKIGGASYGHCALNDALSPLLKEIEDADAIILGSPIYIGTATAQMRAFMERLLFPYVAYSSDFPKLLKKNIAAGFIYTMGLKEEVLEAVGYIKQFDFVNMMMANIFGSSEMLLVTDTYQFDDYSKYVSTMFNAEEKAERRRDVFPHDCDKAYDMGVRFARQNLH